VVHATQFNVACALLQATADKPEAAAEGAGALSDAEKAKLRAQK
jgi:hypothetical protein